MHNGCSDNIPIIKTRYLSSNGIVCKSKAGASKDMILNKKEQDEEKEKEKEEEEKISLAMMEKAVKSYYLIRCQLTNSTFFFTNVNVPANCPRPNLYKTSKYIYIKLTMKIL